jgi:hypothetical protein
MNNFQILKTHFVKWLPLLAVTFIAGCSSQMKMKRVASSESAMQIPIPATAAISTNIVVNNFGPLTDTNVLPILLTATMVSPVDIDLKWSTHIPDVDGYFVDFNFGSDRRFQILDIKYPNETSFHHPNLMPNTRFAYRIRPFFGRPSNVASFVTGDASDEQSGDDGVTPSQVPAGAGGTNSLRNPLTREKAAPTDLTVTRISPRVADLNWKDNASDEDGYFLETSLGSDQNFHFFALLKTNTTSFRASLLPTNTTCYFRVRAYCEGSPSLAVELTTGNELMNLSH